MDFIDQPSGKHAIDTAIDPLVQYRTRPLNRKYVATIGGALLIDPAGAVLLVPIALGPAGDGELRAALPAAPSAIGVELHAQVLLLRGASAADWALSNLVVDRVVPDSPAAKAAATKPARNSCSASSRNAERNGRRPNWPR